MAFIDKFVDKDKLSKSVLPDPRKIYREVLRQASGSGKTRNVAYDIFYQIIAFRGVVDGVGTSTLVANTALAIAQFGLTVCVIDTSMLAPVQDVLLKTSEAVLEESESAEHLDWFDMPYTRKSVLHVSSINRNVSVLSFKGKKHTVVDILSTSDSGNLVDMAFAELHNKFDLILIDTCSELTEVNTTCLQQAQQVIQVWNDSPTVLANMENFITNMVTLSCPLDKMRNVIYSRITKDVIGNMDSLLNQYKLRKIATLYNSEAVALVIVTGKPLWQKESIDEDIIAYTNGIIDISAKLLNIDDAGTPGGTISSNDIMDGKVEGTLHKDLKDYNEEFEANHPEVKIDRNPMGNPEFAEDSDMVDIGNGIDDSIDIDIDGFGGEETEQDIRDSSNVDYNMTMEEDIPEEEPEKPKKKGFGLGRKKDKKRR